MSPPNPHIFLPFLPNTHPQTKHKNSHLSPLPMAPLLPLLLLLLLSLPPLSSSSSDALLLLQHIKPSLQPSSSPQNIQLSSWNSSLLCLWRGLSWSFPDNSPLLCNLPSLRSNLSLLSDPSLQLTSLHLPAAALSGSLPFQLGEFSSLRSLVLAVNSLSGPLPLELFNSPSLSNLDLSHNLLSGSLPLSLWNLCGRLASLRLHGNNLSGPVPPPATANSSCDTLTALDLGANRLAGEFPSFISTFSGLIELDLGGNQFYGELPESVSGLSRLQRLNLSFNNFSGRVPEGLRRGFGAAAFEGNAASFCVDCSSGGLSAGGKAGIVIGCMAGAVVVASASIGWVQGRKRRKGRRGDGESEMGMEEGGDGDGKLVIFEGGEYLTLEDVLNATGQVVEKTSYGTVYKAKLADGGNIALRLLREGTVRNLCD